jgi:hypothetical protein
MKASSILGSGIRKRVVTAAMATAVAATTGGLVLASTASGQSSQTLTPIPFTSYSAKFACGDFAKMVPASAANTVEGPVAPGFYQTSINVHNPNESTVGFQKKALLLYSGTKPVPETSFEQPKPPGQLIPVSLPGDFGMVIDCQDIRKVLLPGIPAAPAFIEGYVVIQVPTSTAGNVAPPLDVTGLYTSYGYNCAAGTPCAREGFSENVVPISADHVTS